MNVEEFCALQQLFALMPGKQHLGCIELAVDTADGWKPAETELKRDAPKPMSLLLAAELDLIHSLSTAWQ